MSGLDHRNKMRAMSTRCGPPRPVRASTVMTHNTTAAERAAAIAAADDARERLHGVPHSALGALGTIMRFRKDVAPPLSTFVDKPTPGGGASPRSPLNGKNPHGGKS